MNNAVPKMCFLSMCKTHVYFDPLNTTPENKNMNSCDEQQKVMKIASAYSKGT